MTHPISGLKRRILKYILVSLALACAILISLRTIYAFSLFNDLSSALHSSGWSDSTGDGIMEPKEDMTFEASYLFFKIGSVRFEVIGKSVYDSLPAYKVRAFIDSYSGIPFVNLHAVFDAYADANTHYCLFSSNSQKDGDKWIYTGYHFNYPAKKFEWEQSENGKLLRKIELPLDKNYTDGVTFFYYLRGVCRGAAGKKTDLNIPIIVDTVMSSVNMTINEKREPCEVTAFDYPLDSYKMSGHINFTGFFGVSGDFTGWMSTDSAEVPLRGDVSVFIGSIVVRLKEIHRAGWTPIRSAD